MVNSARLEWFDRLPCSVMVCDCDYSVLYMNERAAEDHADDGGFALVGTDLMDCHPPDAQAKLREVLASGRPNVYTTQKEGEKKLVYQCQWRKGRRAGGIVQLVIALPRETNRRAR